MVRFLYTFQPHYSLLFFIHDERDKLQNIKASSITKTVDKLVYSSNDVGLTFSGANVVVYLD